MKNQIDVILGMQMGDEGKGRFTYQFAGEGYAIVARFNGGANAGHTFEFNGSEINTHQIPSGISYPGVMNLLTNCSLVDPNALEEEMADIKSYGIDISPNNLGISEAASLVLPHNIMQDGMRELGNGKQGSTKRGIAYVAADKFARSGIFLHQLETDPALVRDIISEGVNNTNKDLRRIGSIEAQKLIRDPGEAYRSWITQAKTLLPFMVNTVSLVGDTMRLGDRILAEGAQSIGLDIDHGIRSENTSSLTGVAGAQQSLGIGPKDIGNIYGVAKLIKSRVGGTKDSFPTMIEDEELAAQLRGDKNDIDGEYGKSTERPRDMGWLDLTDINVATARNSIDQLLLTKLDCIPLAGDTVKIATHYVDADGERIDERPNHVDLMRIYTPVYIELPTWKQNIRGITDFEELPAEAQQLVQKISELTGVEVTMIGTGPDKNEMIDRR